MCLVCTCTKDHDKIGDVLIVSRLGTRKARIISSPMVMFSNGSKGGRAMRNPGLCGQGKCCCVFTPTNNITGN